MAAVGNFKLKVLEGYIFERKLKIDGNNQY